MPLGQELKLNVESHMESVERELAFHISVSNRSSWLNTLGSLAGAGQDSMWCVLCCGDRRLIPSENVVSVCQG